MGVLTVLREIHNTTCDVSKDPIEEAENLTGLQRLKMKVIKALCYFAKYMPKTEQARIIHVIIHFPDLIHRWNNVRNYWAYFNERYFYW